MKNRQLKKRVAILFAIFYFAISLLNPIESEAHDTYFLQVLIDENTKQYQGNVVQDDQSTMSKEAKHIENNLGDFSNLISENLPSIPTEEGGYKKSELGEGIAVFSFNPEEKGEGWGGKKKNHATKDDVDRAYQIRDALVPGLNDALFILNNNQPFETTKELVQMGANLANGSVEGFTITYGSRAFDQPLTTYQKETLGVKKADFVTIKKDGTKEEYEFIFQVPKGYSEEGSFKNRVFSDEYSYADAKYMTWHMLLYQGNYAMFANGWTMADATEIAGANVVEEFFVDLLQSTLNGLRNLLGLYGLNELIYNDGIRGSSAWVHGAMPEAWHDNVVKYHIVFQAFAWSLITLAILKSLIQRNLATINPSMRVSLMEQIQNLLITGFILSAIFPIIAMFMYLNVKIVDVFGSLAPDFNDFSGLNNYSNMLSGMIMQVFYFIVTLYLNFVYIMRSITLAILIAMAPIFVVTIAFGGAWKQLFGVWMRELLSNIFLQSFHAFILAFFVTTTISSRGIEGAVIAFAMIPLTEFFRSMVMGQGGGMAHQLGMGATSAAVNVGTKALGLAGGGKGKKSAPTGNAPGMSTEETMANHENQNGNSSDMAKTQQQPLKSVQSGQGSMLQQKRAMDNKEIPLGVYTKGTDEQKAMYQGSEMSGLKAGVSDALSTMKPNSAKDLAMSVGSGALNTAKGVAQAGVGAGMMLALGGSNPFMVGQAMNMMSDGASQVKSAVGQPMSAVGQAVSQVREGIAMDRQPQFNTPVNQSGMSNSHMGIQPTPNGNGFFVHRSANQMQEESGITSATMSGENAVYQYDSSRLSQGDRANLEQYENTFVYGSQESRDNLRDQGVENVTRRNDGGYAVTYNRAGMEQMGIQSVNTVGSGESKRIVETKRNDQPIPTFNSVNVPQAPTAPPRPSTILDSSGTPLQSSSPPPPPPLGMGRQPQPNPPQPPTTN